MRRKVEAVSRMLAAESGGAVIGLTNPCAVKGIIADTSIEHDHERFNGFLKVTVEEILIALRDDHKFLGDPIGVLGKNNEEDGDGTLAEKQAPQSLYVDGFNALRFLEVLENELVWLEADSGATQPMS